MNVFGQNCSIRANVVVFGQELLYSGISGIIRAIVVLFGQKWLYSGKSGCIRAKSLYSSK